MKRASISGSFIIRLLAIGALAATFGACGGDAASDGASADSSAGTSTTASEETAEATSGVEKVKPAAGTGNVQGKVLFNGKPVTGIEVTLCEEFSRFGSGCGGQTYKAKTDDAGDYVITNVPPKEYAALLAQVFDTDSYVFATQGYGISSEKYKVEADKTLFVRATNLFKSDLKVMSPKAGSKVAAAGLGLNWEPYPEAAYYKFSLFPDSASVVSPYINHRVEANQFSVDKPLPTGGYRIEVEAYNGDDIKLAEGPNDIMFTVQ